MISIKNTEQSRPLPRRAWIVIVIAAFGLVYLASLTFVYVEGDDAASIVYHAAHNTDIHPYSPYHSMMDLILGLLPANELLLRTSAIALTSVAAVGMVIFMLALAFDWFGESEIRGRWLVALVVMLAAPEFFYLGLVYLPSVIAICLVLAAHLVLRQAIRAHESGDVFSAWKIPSIIPAIVLFAIGAACRWDIMAYGIVIVADLIAGVPGGSSSWKQPIRRRVAFGVSWGIVALLATLLAIVITGYGPADVMNIATDFLSRSAGQSNDPVGISGSSLTEIGAGLVAYFSPVTVTLGAIGFLSLLRRRSPILLPVIAGLLIAIPWLISGAPKDFLAGIPSMTVCVVFGFEAVWYGIQQPALRTGARTALIACLAAMWLIGIRVNSDTAWGPGFEIRPFDRPAVQGTHYSLAIGPGIALSLPDGPRPLFGHAYVLLGGLWRRFVIAWSDEQDRAVATAVSMNIPELRVDRQNPGLAVFVKLGYSVSKLNNDAPLLGSWDFVGPGSTHETMLALYDRTAIFRKDGVAGILQAANQDKVVIYGFPSSLRKLYELDPGSLQALGPTSAILDLQHLRQTIP